MVTASIKEYYDIESDSSDYSNTDESEDDQNTDDDLLCMTEEEKQDTKYLAIFQNNSDEFDEQVISVENQEQLKKLELSMKDRTDKGYYRCKIKHQTLYEEFMRAMEKYITPSML